MSKRNVIFSIIAVFVVLTLSSFVGYDNEIMEAPGRIEFIGEAGSPNLFVFKKWSIDKAEVPAGDMEKVQVELTIETGSLATDWKDLEKNIRKKKDYFYARKFPKATVTIDGATRQDDGSYTTDAMLTLKGITKPVTLTFTASEEAPYLIKGTGVVKRRKFDFTGGGPKNEVPVNFELTLGE